MCKICGEEKCGCLYNPFPELDEVKLTEEVKDKGWKNKNKEDDKYNKTK